ncbi:hypothetical protein Shewana3_1383 [Shewanella sp. ANA-3]|uniref:O-antigen polymerase n=1 Tax=Shewanella sp. (strain ANA-3) TaxID=94122 RepID=UPI00005DD7D8|nr:O-antigen polymerase [Shewanella sp. ANA-3]ABK47617.1 hypothetical protein Shewana3_1383 [Shewanella sp. ANA-3]
MLYFLIVSVIILRITFLKYFNGSRNIGYILPLFLELIFIYPFFIVDILGLKWSIYGFIVLYSSILSLQIGLLPLKSLPNNRVNAVVIKKKILLNTIYISIPFYLVGVLSNFSLSQLADFSLSNYLSIANSSALERYSGTQVLTIQYKIGSIFCYYAMFTVGFLVGTKSVKCNSIKHYYFLAVLLFLIALLDSFLMAARAGMMMMSFCFFSSYFVTSQYLKSGKLIAISIPIIFKLLSVFFLIFGFFLVIQIFRGGKEDYDFLNIVNHLLTWFIGHISAFSNWIDAYDLYTKPNLGFSTLAGISDLIGVKERDSGIYVATDIGEGRLTNIYTSLRPLIEDYSILGVFVVYTIFGLIFSFFIKTKHMQFKGVLFICCVGITVYLCWSFVTSIFVYNTILFSFFCFSLASLFFVKFK